MGVEVTIYPTSITRATLWSSARSPFGDTSVLQIQCRYRCYALCLRSDPVAGGPTHHNAITCKEESSWPLQTS